MLQQPVTTAFPMRGMLIAIHTSAILRLPLANVTRVRMASSAKQRHSHSHERWGESNRLGFHPTPGTNPGWVGPAVTGSTSASSTKSSLRRRIARCVNMASSKDISNLMGPCMARISAEVGVGRRGAR